MKIIKSDFYNHEAITRDGLIDASALAELKRDPEQGLTVIKQFRQTIKSTLVDFDRRWRLLCKGNEEELGEWNARLLVAHLKLAIIDRELASNNLLFNWDLVLDAMGFLNALRETTDLILAHNENLPKA